MTTLPRSLDAEGVVVQVPSGWEARVVRPASPGGAQDDGSVAHVFVQLATFPLVAGDGPYGGEAVARMSSTDLFAALVEFEPASARSALFAAAGPPRRLPASTFSGAQLQRTLRGQLGTQRFFHASGRAWCLYVVLGGHAARGDALRTFNRVLGSLALRARVLGP